MDINDLRRDQSKIYFTDSMLRSVQINPTELCNRTCNFCPRHDPKIYPNQNKHIDVKTVENLCLSLKEMNFNNRIGFVGFGEPLLCKTIFKCIKKVKEIIPNIKWLEVNTNGDKLDKDIIEKLYKSGCTHISISMYDEDLTSYYDYIKGDIPITLIYRHHYDKKVNYNLNIVNRSDLLKNTNVIHNNNPCYIPFYKIFIDWNGDVLLCDNNWKKDVKFGNVNNKKFKDIWLGKEINQYRDILLTNRNISPCKNCSVIGNYEDRGKDSVKIYKNYVKS